MIRLPSVLLFDPDSATLDDSADAVLRPIAAEVVNSNGRIVITETAGHTADVAASDGLKLSQRRAQAVGHRRGRLGLPPASIHAVIGRGETLPVTANRALTGQFSRPRHATAASKSRRATPSAIPKEASHERTAGQDKGTGRDGQNCP